MDAAVEHENAKPVFFKRDLFFTSIVVDKLKVDLIGINIEYSVYYAGTSMYNSAALQLYGHRQIRI